MKRHDPTPRPAVERYDGPVLRAGRRYRAPQPTEPPATYVLPATHGLIPIGVAIDDYDQYLTDQQARELQSVIETEPSRLIRSLRYGKRTTLRPETSFANQHSTACA
jgi:hypothetical protein